MKWLEEFIKKYPNMQTAYEQEALKCIQYEKDELKKKVPEHRWWEINDIDSMKLDLPDTEKDRLRTDELHNEIMKILINMGIKSLEIMKILEDLENVAETLNDRDKKEMEILLIEGLINATLSQKIYDDFYEILGPQLRQMCDSNNEFWVKLGEKNKNKQDEAYALLVENKKIEDEEKKDGNLYG